MYSSAHRHTDNPTALAATKKALQDMTLHRTLAVAAAAIALLSSAAAAQAATSIPYPNSGQLNPTTYSFTASTTGEIIGYFAGSGAGWDEQVGMMVNGKAPTAFGLDDHSSAIGASFDFGHVNAGDSLVFVLQANGNPGKFAYSDATLNGPYDSLPVGTNHVYSTSYTDGSLGHAIPAGTYLAFEDLPTSWSDHNYFDDTFVFTNVGTQFSAGGASAVPEPAGWALMILGVGGIGAALRSRRARTLQAA